MAARTALVIVAHVLEPWVERAVEAAGLASLSRPDAYDSYLLYDRGRMVAPSCEWPGVQCAAMDASSERSRYPSTALQTFAGIYGAPAKLAELEFLIDRPQYDFAWFVEADAVFTGDWAAFMDVYDADGVNADLIAPEIHINDTAGYENVVVEGREAKKWPYYAGCDAADATWHSRAFLPAHRLSTNLARATRRYLMAGGAGHHECVLATLCQRLPSCTVSRIAPKWLGVVRYRPGVTAAEIAAGGPNKIFHPVKPKTSFDRAARASAAYSVRWHRMVAAHARSLEASPLRAGILSNFLTGLSQRLPSGTRTTVINE